MRKLLSIAGIIVLFASCKKTKTYPTAPTISVYNSNTKTGEPNVKLALKDGGKILQQGRTDSSGNFPFTEFPGTEGHSYEIWVDLGCGEGECHIKLGSKAVYGYTVTPANNTFINCPGMPTFGGTDSMRVEFKHKYLSSIGNNPEALSWFFVSSHTPLPVGSSLVTYTGKYYVTIYRAKSGVLTTSYDTITIPTPTTCTPSFSVSYSY